MPATESPRSRQGAGSANSTRTIAPWVVIVGVFTVCLVRLAGLVYDGAVNVLYADQWDFLAPLFRGEGPWACFVQQHGPHRLGLGGVVQWACYNWSNWDARAEAWCGVAVLVGAAVAAVALAARVRGRLVWWDAALPLVILSPLHWETLLLSPDLAHSVLPLGLILLLAHAWLARPSTARLVGVGLTGVLCIFTGFGLCAAPAAIAVALAGLSRANPDRRGAGWSLGLLAGGLALFFIGYRWDPAVPGWHFPVTDWWNYGTFAAYMTATLVGLREKSVAAIGVGGAVFALEIAVFARALWLIWTRGATPRATACALLTGTSLTYAAFTAFGRLPVNIEAAFMWRYTTLSMTGVLGLIIFVQPWTEGSIRPAWRALTLAGVCALGVAIWGNFGPEERVAAIAAAKRKWVKAYLETHDLARANALSQFWVYPPKPDAPHIAERLRWLEARKASLFKEP